MKNLKAFVKQENAFRAIFNQRIWDLDHLDQDSVNEIFTSLDSKLSPENLTCDGEASPAQVRKFAALYRGAVAELKGLGWFPSVTVYEI